MASKYSSVIVRGFRAVTALADIRKVLVENGMPAEHEEEKLMRNENTGSLTVTSLKAEECQALNMMNKKRFLNRQIFITSVVGNSPTKSPPVTEPPNSLSLTIGLIDPVTGAIKPPATPTLGEKLIPRPVTNPNSSEELSGFVFGLVSPGVQDKIQHIEELKRKSEGSPEGDSLSRKDKKILRKDEKSQKKKEKKQELKDNQKLQENKDN